MITSFPDMGLASLLCFQRFVTHIIIEPMLLVTSRTTSWDAGLA